MFLFPSIKVSGKRGEMGGKAIDFTREFAVEDHVSVEEDVHGLLRRRVLLRVRDLKGERVRLFQLVCGVREEASELIVNLRESYVQRREMDLADAMVEFALHAPHFAYDQIELSSRGAILALFGGELRQFSTCAFCLRGSSVLDLPKWVGKEVTWKMTYKPWYMALQIFRREQASIRPPPANNDAVRLR